MNDDSINVQLIKALIERLRSKAEDARIAVLTGAGASAESGIPPFRDSTKAIWSDNDVSEFATPDAWRRDAAKVWAWYESRRHAAMTATPNAGHRAIADLERQYEVTVLTQNVDDLHERAGSSRVIHLHGSLFAPHCFACKRPGEFNRQLVSAEAPQPASLEPPRCRRCGGKLRPGVVWFGEPLPEQAWREATRVVAEADLLLVIGTSGTVQPVAQLPSIAAKRGVPILEINLQPVLGSLNGNVLTWTGNAAQALIDLRDQLL